MDRSLTAKNQEIAKFKEISEVLDMKETAIRVTLSRARKTLKEKLIKAHNYGVTAN